MISIKTIKSVIFLYINNIFIIELNIIFFLQFLNIPSHLNIIYILLNKIKNINIFIFKLIII